MRAKRDIRVSVQRRRPHRPPVQVTLPRKQPQASYAPIFEPTRLGSFPGRCEWLDRAKRPGLVIGGALGNWRDVATLETLIDGFWPGVVVIVNDVGEWWHREPDHWATLHPEKLFSKHCKTHEKGWRGMRADRGLPPSRQLWSHAKNPNWPVNGTVKQWASGSSGLLGIAVAAEVGCDAIVLAGIPMDERPHFAESSVHDPKAPWMSVRSHIPAWKRPPVMDQLKAMCRSMSGWSREVLGAPEPGMLDTINVELYRIGISDLYHLPNGAVCGLDEAKKVLLL